MAGPRPSTATATMPATVASSNGRPQRSWRARPETNTSRPRTAAAKPSTEASRADTGGAVPVFRAGVARKTEPACKAP